MDLAPLSGRPGEILADAPRLQTCVRVKNYQPDLFKAPLPKPCDQGPVSIFLRFVLYRFHGQDLGHSLYIHAFHEHHRHVLHTPSATDLLIKDVYPEHRVFRLNGPVAKLLDHLDEPLVDLAHL